MSAPAIVQGDRVMGICPNHTVGGPPVPAGPLPFSAPLTLGLVPTVLIGGRPAAVVGASGYNTPPHTGAPVGPVRRADAPGWPGPERQRDGADRRQAGGDRPIELHVLRHAGPADPHGLHGPDRVRGER